MSARFERLSSRTAYDGEMVTVRVYKIRSQDGQERDREVVHHPGSVAMVVHDGNVVWLVRQPREAVGAQDLLELPAGKLDERGETPLDAARRELAAEVGLSAEQWEHVHSYFSSPGFTDEEVHVYLATDVSTVTRPPAADQQRIDVVTWPLEDLDGLIDQVHDAKTLVGLLALRRRR
jgi:8-oxo-dGTP pyrophosphatase MutT (NUDIX family)